MNKAHYLKERLTAFRQWSALLFSFAIPFHPQVSTLLIIVWLILSFFYIENPQRIKRNLWVLPALLVTYVLGTLLSTNQNFAILGRKLSLLIFPLIFLLHYYNDKARLKIFKFFVYGLFVSSVFCLLYALFRSIHVSEGTIYFNAAVQEGRGFIESVTFGGNFLFGKQLSIFHQTVYLSIYLCTGVALLLNFRLGLTRARRMGLVSFFALIIFLVSNKAGMITLILLLASRLAFSDITVGRKVILLGIFLLSSLLFVKMNPRFEGSVSKGLSEGIVLDKQARYGFSTRLLAWDASLELIRKNWFKGYGPGDTQNELDSVYLKKEYAFPLKEGLNAHNQFFQIWLENGLLGISVFLFSFLLLAKRALYLKNRRLILFATIVIFFVNACFESYFNRYSGISFFAFWWCLMITDSSENED